MLNANHNLSIWPFRLRSELRRDQLPDRAETQCRRAVFILAFSLWTLAFAQWTSAAVTVLGVQYQPDKMHPEFDCIWSNGNYPTSCPSNFAGANVHVYLRNDEATSINVTNVTLAGYELKTIIKERVQGGNDPYSIYYYWDNPPQAIFNAGEPVWYRHDPTNLPPGAVCQVVVRLRLLPVTQPVSVGVMTDAGTVTTNIAVSASAPQLVSVGFSPDLDKVYLHWRRSSGAAPISVFMDGNDVTSLTTTVGDTNFNFAVSVISLASPLTYMSYHVYQGVYADGKTATASLRSWINRFNIGTYGAYPTTTWADARALIDDYENRGVNFIVYNNGSEGFTSFINKPEGVTYCDEHGFDFMPSTPSQWNTRDPLGWYLRDEPDAHDWHLGRSDTSPYYLPKNNQHSVGVLAMHEIFAGDDLHYRQGEITPTVVNVDATYMPYNYYTYGQLADIGMSDPYYNSRQASAYWGNTNTIPLYDKPYPYIYAVSQAMTEASEPSPSLIAMMSTGDLIVTNGWWPYPTMENIRMQNYYAVAGGAKNLGYWWMLGEGYVGFGEGIVTGVPECVNLWKGIGLCGNEFKTLQPLIVISHPAALTISTSTNLWARGLVAGMDSIILVVANDRYTNDIDGIHYSPISNSTVTVTLPSWFNGSATSFEVAEGAEGVKDVSTSLNGNQLQFNLGTVNLTRLLVATTNAQWRGTIQKRYLEKSYQGVCSFAPEHCLAQTACILSPGAEDGFRSRGGGMIANNWYEFESTYGTNVTGYDETTIKHSGSHSQRIKLQIPGGGSGGLYQRFPAVPGANYTVSAWTYAGDTTSSCYVGVDRFGGVDAASGNVTWSTVNNTVAWVQKSLNVTAATNFMTIFYKVVSVTGIRNGYFDDATPACSSPYITQHPSATNVAAGGTATFSVAAGGSAPYSYQWQKNGLNLSSGGHYSGVTASTLTISTASTNDFGSYRCVVTTSYGTVTANAATLTLLTAPTITQQPTAQSVCSGSNATFTVTASGTGTIGYQWQRYQTNLANSGHYSGVTTTNLAITGVDASDVGNFRCAVTNQYGTNYSDEVALSLAATTTITQHPTNQTVCLSSSGIFTVTATGGSPFTYQWRKNGTNISNGGHYSGVTTATLTVSGADATDVADYSCFVAGSCSSITSSPGTLILQGATVFSQQPSPQTVCPGSNAVFSIAATGEGTLTYQWQKNAVNLTNGSHYSGVTTSTLTITAVNTNDAANYVCVVASGCGSSNSSPGVLTVRPGTIITVQPSDQQVLPGETATFGIAATGEGTVNYQWQTNGVNLANNSHYGGVSSAALWVTNVSSADQVNYRCVVSGGCGSVTSSLAMLTLNTCDPGDVLGHGDMEDPTSYSVCPDWTSYSAGSGTATWSKETTIVTNGLASQKCRNLNGVIGSLLGIRQTIGANVGDAFTFTGWVYPVSNPGAGQKVGMCVRWDGSTSNPATNQGTWAISSASGDSWTQLTNSGAATSSSLTLYLDSRGYEPADITAYWDDILCYRAFVPPAPLVTPGINSLEVGVAPGCNWTNSSAQYAITIGGGSYTLGTHWVQANGTVATSPVWQADATWATTTVTGLLGSTAYTLKVQARYSSAYTQPTALGASAVATTDGPVPPSIIQHPSAQNVCSNATASFHVTASGPGTITYQWQKNGENLSNGGHYSGATTTNLTVSSADSNDLGDYSCVVSNAGGSVSSSEAALTLKTVTAITGEPSAQNVCPGEDATFTVAADGNGTLAYQWQTNGMNITDNSHYGGCTNATLWVTNVGNADAVNYRCVVAGDCGSATSSAPAMTFKAATAITQEPLAQSPCLGANATFTVAATGDGMLTYQWQTNGVNITNDSHYGGCADVTLWVTNVGNADEVDYRCVVTGGCGIAVSSEPALTLGVVTAITAGPVAQNVCFGSNATFMVSAIGNGTLLYQWQTNGVDLIDGSHYGGCTTETLTVTNVGVLDTTGVDYNCVVIGGCGNATSSTAGLTFKAATVITQQPGNQHVPLSSNATFSVVATGDGTLTYQWRKNGDDLTDGGHYSGVTTATLTVSGANGSDVGVYACEVNGGCGSVTSSNGTISVSYGVTNDYAVNRAVPDASFTGASDTRSISAAIHSVTNLKVRLKISGTYNGDLFCYLTHGSGYSVLLNRVGRRADSAFGYGDPGLDVTFEDGATNDVHDYRLTATGNHSIPLGTNLMGTWVADGRTNRPTEVLDTDARPALLSSFNGVDPNGDWTVFVADVGAGDSHTLVSWGLEISGTEEPSAPAVATVGGTVKLQAYLGSSRVVRFISSAVSGGVTNYLQTNDVTLSFSGGEAGYSLEVPTNTTHVSAKTAWHLRKRLPVTFVGGAATNDFTGTDWLLGGDLVTAIGSTSIEDTDNLVNAVDLGLLLGYYLNVVGSDALIGRADIDGDGVVDMVNAVDLSILLGNYLLPGDGP
jgi:subtilisin-like proprotein convertase family protein/Cu/Zn superoxide dismutase